MPGTTASTGQSSLCSSHSDDFFFKIHLEGSCVTFIFHPGLPAHSALKNTGHLEDYELTLGTRVGEIF